MSRTLSRVAALAATTPFLAAAMIAVAQAASATHIPPPPSCPTATPLVDFDVSGSPTTVIVQTVSSTQTNVCLRSLGLFDLVLVVNSNVGLVEPDVDTGGGTFACAATPLFEARQPVPLRLSYSTGGANGTLCIEVNGTATTLNIAALPSITTIPSFQLWTNGGTDLDRFVLCAGPYATWVTSSASSAYYAWVDCYDSPRRVV